MTRLFSKPLLTLLISVLVLILTQGLHTTVEKSKHRFVGGTVRLVDTDTDLPLGSTFAVRDYESHREVGLEGVESNGYLPKERFTLPYKFELIIEAYEGGNCDWVFSQGGHYFRMRKN